MSEAAYTPMRDLDARPYSPDEERVAKWLVEKTGIGAGDDPIGFLIASHDMLAAQRKVLREALGEVSRRNTLMRDHLTGRLEGEAVHHFFGPLEATQSIISDALNWPG